VATGRTRTRLASHGRRGSKRDELLKLIEESEGLTRGEILEKMGLKGNKSGEMSVSNSLTALTKSNQVRRGENRKYVAGRG
jgi:Fe2+ or Zn2+ uptake regulation protein